MGSLQMFGSEQFREKQLRMLAKRPTQSQRANGYHGRQLNDSRKSALEDRFGQA